MLELMTVGLCMLQYSNIHNLNISCIGITWKSAAYSCELDVSSTAYFCFQTLLPIHEEA